MVYGMHIILSIVLIGFINQQTERQRGPHSVGTKIPGTPKFSSSEVRPKSFSLPLWTVTEMA